MHGLLVINGFLQSAKFTQLYAMLTGAAAQLGMTLAVARSDALLHNPDELRRLACDFVLFWDKDVLLAEMLEECGYPVFNSASAIYACDNKAATAFRLQQAGVKTPRSFAAPLTFEGVDYPDLGFADRIAAELGYPLILKELYGSFGRQVYLIHDRAQLAQCIGALGHKGFLLQEFIESSRGKDVRINVVGGRVLCAMLRYSETGDFRSNISNGGSMRPYPPTDAQAALALQACSALGLDFAGVDVLFGRQGEPVICEINSNPHFKSTLDCTGVDMSLAILRHIQEALR